MEFYIFAQNIQIPSQFRERDRIKRRRGGNCVVAIQFYCPQRIIVDDIFLDRDILNLLHYFLKEMIILYVYIWILNMILYMIL